MTSRSNGFYENMIRPLLFRMDPEDAHHLAQQMMPMFAALKPLTETWHSQLSSRLEVNIAGTKLSNPIGLAAGFDKNAKLTHLLRCFGFGFAEIGSVTGRASRGNPRPRIFRLPQDEAIINYMGLNGDGANVVAERLAREQHSLPLALSIAKTNDPKIVNDLAVADFLASFKAVKDLPLVMISVNVSCPNTHESKLAEVGMLDTVLTEMQKINDKRIPLFVKLSPDSDLELLHGIAEIVSRHHLAGYICGNTSLDRSRLSTPAERLSQIGPGGLSGPPILEKALELCRRLYELKDPDQQIIGCGGITSGADAFRFIAAGANAVELYTGLVYHGPFLPFQICRQLDKILEEQKLTMTSAVGARMQASNSTGAIEFRAGI